MAEDAGQQVMDMTFYLKHLVYLYVFFLKLFLRWLLWPLYKSLPDYPEERLRLLREKFNSGPIAHRGGVPENTIEAFQSSKQYGVRVVEVDLNFTKDDNPVLLHDEVVDRTSNGSGWINKMTLEQAKMLDVGVKFDCPGAKIPTLMEAITSAKELGLFVILDVKGSSSETVTAVCKLFENDRSLYSCVSVSSFFPDVIYQLRCCDPLIYCGMACASTEFCSYPNQQPYFGSNRIKQKLAEVMSYVFYWVLLNWAVNVIKVGYLLPMTHDVRNGRFNAKKFTSKGLAMAVWTVNTLEEYNYFQNKHNLSVLTDKVADLYT